MLAAQIEEPLVRIYEDALSLGREVPASTRVVRAPHDMGPAWADVQDLGDGTALVFWTGWRRPEGDHSRGEGRVCRLLSLRALLVLELIQRAAEPEAEEAPLRVLVPPPDGGRIWFVAEVGGSR